jgi:hypothetical protein
LNECKIPAIAELEPVVHIFLADAINEVAEEKSRGTD